MATARQSAPQHFDGPSRPGTPRMATAIDVFEHGLTLREAEGLWLENVAICPVAEHCARCGESFDLRGDVPTRFEFGGAFYDYCHPCADIAQGHDYVPATATASLYLH